MAKGFTLPKKTAALRFEGTDYDGAEVEVRTNMSLGFYLDYDEHRMENPLLAYTQLAEVVTAWNLTGEAGAAVPITEDGMRTVPWDLCRLISQGWSRAVSEVTDPLVAAAAEN